ncbi:MAG: CrcB family protein [Candidatus Latescibacteria bacterium]|nr:CrcB family protein [Candidatus Latescibacterota bacterium]MBT4136935.1 CrcB family protein [Candidatus Latescibacterota bacterium]
MRSFFLVGMGGALGAMCRYGLAMIAARFVGTAFAWGTLAANLLGCLLIGFALALADARVILGPSERLFFMTGFLGALTTFSTYALESLLYAKSGALGTSMMNLFANHFFGIGLVLVGLWLGGRFVSGNGGTGH